MAFENPPLDQIFDLIRRTHTIAVVGLSPRAERPSHGVAKSLIDFGCRIIPVRPGVESILAQKAYGDLHEIPQDLREEIDIVQVFRRPEYVDGVVDRCIELQLPALWLQDGVIDHSAAERAQTAGIMVVMDRCLFRDRVALMQQGGWAP